MSGRSPVGAAAPTPRIANSRGGAGSPYFAPSPTSSPTVPNSSRKAGRHSHGERFRSGGSDGRRLSNGAGARDVQPETHDQPRQSKNPQHTKQPPNYRTKQSPLQVRLRERHEEQRQAFSSPVERDPHTPPRDVASSYRNQYGPNLQVGSPYHTPPRQKHHQRQRRAHSASPAASAARVPDLPHPCAPYATPPRSRPRKHRESHDPPHGVNMTDRYNAGQRVDYDEQYRKFQSAAQEERRMNRAQSAGAAELRGAEPVPAQEYRSDGDDAGSKKSRGSSGMLSRASKGLKKRLRGQSKNGAGEKVVVRRAASDPEGDVASMQWSGEGRDPSPTNDDANGGWVYSGTNQEREQSDRNCQDLLDLPSMNTDDDESSKGSTLTTNFSAQPTQDVLVTPNQSSDAVPEGLMPRIENFLAAPPVVGKARNEIEKLGSHLHQSPKKPQKLLQSAPLPAISEPRTTIAWQGGKGSESVNTDQSWREENWHLSAEMQQLRAKLAKSEEAEEMASLASSKQIDDLSRKNETLSSELQQLRAKLAEREEAEEMASLASSKQIDELSRKNGTLSSDLKRMKEKMSEQEEEMEVRKRATDRELQTQEQELDAMRRHEEILKSAEAAADEKLSAYVTHLSGDLDAYKGECATYRERILEKERQNSALEHSLYEERKRVQSLEAENQMLLDIADDNASLATSTKRCNSSNLNAYKEQCNKYRQTVLELEGKLMMTEGAMEATGQVVASLEQDKKLMAAQLSQMRSSLNSAQSKLVDRESTLAEKEPETSALRDQLSTLQNKWTQAESQMAVSKTKADEDRKTIAFLEGENASLLLKVNESNASLEKLTPIAEQCQQLEEDNTRLKKRNEELMDREIAMTKEADDARVLAANADRRHKRMDENERFIAQLQEDLSQARASHLKALQSTRTKCSDEVAALTAKLQAEVGTRRCMEMEKSELENKIASMERAYADLEDLIASQAKAHNDQHMKVMEHSDDLRKKHAESQEENASLKHQLAETSGAHDRLARELEGKVALLKKENAFIATRLEHVNTELSETRESRSREIGGLERALQEKDIALTKLQDDHSKIVAERTSGFGGLEDAIHRLERELAEAVSARDALKKHVRGLKDQFLDVTKSMRAEKALLLTGVQSQLLEEKTAMANHVKDMVVSYGERIKRHQHEQTMGHSVAMTTIQSEKRQVERLLSAEYDKSSELEAALDRARAENQSLAELTRAACSKVAASGNAALLDAIDDCLIDRSDAQIQLRTLEVELAALKTKSANLEYENNQLSKQIEVKEKEVKETGSELELKRDALKIQRAECGSLEERVEKLKQEAGTVQNQMKEAFNADRRAQDKVVEEILSAKEAAVSQLEALREKVESLTKDVSERDERVVDLQHNLDASDKKCLGLESRYEQCRQELADLLDKNVSSKHKADELMSHYMHIEDDLRFQLQSVQSERNDLERKLTIVERESDRLIDEFCKEKKELASTLELRDESIRVLEQRLDETKGLQQQYGQACSELEAERASHARAQTRIGAMMTERDDALRQVKNLQSDVVSIERERDAAASALLAERVVHANAVGEHQSLFDDELEQQRSKMQTQISEMASLKAEAKRFRDDADFLSLQNEKKGRQISELKASLKEALEEALRLGSKITSEQSRLMELTHTMSSFEEENTQLKRSLESSRSEVIVNLKLSLGRVTAEKERIGSELAEKETKLFSTLAELTHVELKLTKIERERDEQLAEARAEIERLHNDLQTRQQGKEQDDASTVSGASRVSHLLGQTASDLEGTIAAIKKHHSATVQKLQMELADTRKRLKKYERKVKELSTLLEDNAILIGSLHSKIRGKRRGNVSPGLPPRPTQSSDESLVSA